MMFLQSRHIVAILRRDIKVHLSDGLGMYFNNAILFPITFVVCFGLFMPALYFERVALPVATIITSGVLLELVFITTFFVCFPFLFDMETTNLTSYQLQTLRAPALLFEKVLFSSGICLFYILPYFPIAKLIVGKEFDITNLNIPSLLLMLFLASITASTYHVMMCCMLRSYMQVGKWWMRLSYPLLELAGFFVPWHAMMNFSRQLGLVSLCNPFLYISEGIRGSVLGFENYLPLYTIVPALLIANLLFFSLSVWFFKRKVDHI